jgi:hypothetical protein
VADLSLDKEVLKAVISKNVWSAAGLQPKTDNRLVCTNVFGLLVGKARATMSNPRVAVLNNGYGLEDRFFRQA